VAQPALQWLRFDGLYDEPRPGAPRQIGDDEIAETIRRRFSRDLPGRHTGAAQHGVGSGPCALDGAPHLKGVRAAAASQRNL
jgi:hypothetical protein